MGIEETREPQYQGHLNLRESKGLTPLGLMTNGVWDEDPRRLLFMLARAKFVSKMLSGKGKVLEVGCGDAFASRIVVQEVGELVATDFDPAFVKDVNERMEEKWRFECRVHDIVEAPMPEPFEAAYSLDVLEHIPKEDEHRFVENTALSLVDEGVMIVGSPSIQSQAYASETSRLGHVNCKDAGELKELMLEYFHNVFIFSMNDEIVHTGFYPLAHYLFALGVGKRRS